MMTEHSKLPKEGTMVALYARVSTERQEREDTIESQIKCLKDFAEQQRYIVYDVYQDDGYSGELLDRPDLDRLRDHAEQKKFKAVLIYSWDRLSREFWHQAMLTEKFDELEIPIISIDNPQIADTPEAQLQRDIQGSFAKYEKGKIADRTRRGKLHKARQGIVITSRAPYGYKYIPKNKGGPKYTINEKEAKVVRRIFKMFTQKHMGIRTICGKLYQAGISTKTGRDVFSKSSIARIISNTVYIGKAYYNKHRSMKSHKSQPKKYVRRPNRKLILRPVKEWIEIEVPRIIDTKTFNKAQELLEIRKKHFRRPPKHSYLLSGLLICGRCGHRINSTPYRNGPYYRCGNTKKKLGTERRCDAKSIRAEGIEKIVWRKIEGLINNPSQVMRFIERIKSRQHAKAKAHKSEIDHIAARIRDIDDQEGRYYELYSEGEFNKEILKKKLEELHAEKRTLIAERDEIEGRLEDISALPVDFKPSQRLISECLKHLRQKMKDADFGRKQEILRLLVKQVIFDDHKVVIQGFIPIFSLKNGRLLSKSSGCYDHQQRRFRARALHDVDP